MITIRSYQRSPETSGVYAVDMQQHATQWSLENVSIRQFRDAAVLASVLVTRKGTAETREPTTVVFVMTAGVWKIASAHWSALPSQAFTK